MRCKRCGDPLTVYVLNERYCTPCKREVRQRETADERRMTARARFGVVKDLTGFTPGAA
jgi:uncharacterized OB-fold protein